MSTANIRVRAIFMIYFVTLSRPRVSLSNCRRRALFMSRESFNIREMLIKYKSREKRPISPTGSCKTYHADKKKKNKKKINIFMPRAEEEPFFSFSPSN